MNAVAIQQDHALAVHSMTADQVELVKRTICKGADNDELQMFLYQCKRTGLDPFARQIYAVKRWNSDMGREVMSTQVSIDGFRLTAERSGKYAGQLGPWWTADGSTWVDCWISKDPPRAARVGILRTDFKEPLYAVAVWDSYKQTSRKGDLTPMWRKMPELMLAKVAEALALRKAFPMELSGIYTAEEMAQATEPDPESATSAAPAATPAAPALPAPPPDPVDPTVVSNGKHKGKKWSEISDQYIAWAMTSETAPAALKEGAGIERCRRDAQAVNDKLFDDDSRIPH